MVFGSPSRRQRVYQAVNQQIDDVSSGLDRLGIEAILDIGSDSVAPAQLGDIPTRQLGTLPSSEISDVLSDCRAGLIYSSGLTLTKSTMAAACFSHGLLTINTGQTDEIPTDMAVLRVITSPFHHAEDLNRLQEIASEGYVWYQQHRVEATVNRILASLLPN
jgi:hypothetical protein